MILKIVYCTLAWCTWHEGVVKIPMGIRYEYRELNLASTFRQKTYQRKCVNSLLPNRWLRIRGWPQTTRLMTALVRSDTTRLSTLWQWLRCWHSLTLTDISISSRRDTFLQIIASRTWSRSRIPQWSQQRFGHLFDVESLVIRGNDLNLIVLVVNFCKDLSLS